MNRKICFLFMSFFALALGRSGALEAADAAAGKAKYDLLCVTCHGATGKGDGAAATALNPKPRNFQDTTYMNKKSDVDLKKVIQKGGAAVGMSPIMPPWGASLTDQDVANVIAYIRSLGKK